MPYDGEGDGAWTALGCFPVADNPGQPGDECTVEESGVSGVDTCDIASQCWDVDPETNTGTCAAMCSGAIDNPICDDPDTGCVIANDELIVLCLPTCDPIIQDCPDGLGCYPVDAGFFCAPDGSGAGGAQGDPCTSINGCDPSLMCVNAAAYGPLCGAAACCTAFCNVDDGDTCPVGAQECVSFFADGMAPPGFEEVGVCVEPA